MKYRIIISCVIPILLASCYQPERDCQAFKEGKFTFTTTVNGEEKTTTFVRSEDREIDMFEGKADTSSVRWVNDCEYILKKINPKDNAEEKSVHIKILSTTAESYLFEYGLVGETKKSRGTAFLNK